MVAEPTRGFTARGRSATSWKTSRVRSAVFCQLKWAARCDPSRSMRSLVNPAREPCFLAHQHQVLLELGVGAHEARKGADQADLILTRLDIAHRKQKSTRLNSSHLVISYAVFCLKKKN